jgi:hypothetical protein
VAAIRKLIEETLRLTAAIPNASESILHPVALFEPYHLKIAIAAIN